MNLIYDQQKVTNNQKTQGHKNISSQRHDHYKIFKDINHEAKNLQK